MTDGLVSFERVRDWEANIVYCHSKQVYYNFPTCMLQFMTSIYTIQVGWVMNDGLVSFERVRDWEAKECQRHICEIQGIFPAPKMTDLYRKPSLS